MKPRNKKTGSPSLMRELDPHFFSRLLDHYYRVIDLPGDPLRFVKIDYSDQAPRPKGGASSGQVGLADYRLLRDTCPSSEEDASIGGTAPKPCKNQDLSWGNLSPKPPNEDDIPPRPEDGASCHGLVRSSLTSNRKSIPKWPVILQPAAASSPSISHKAWVISTIRCRGIPASGSCTSWPNISSMIPMIKR